MICDRNSIATKREEFPARVVEVTSSRLHLASLARLLQLLQQTYPALCQQPAWNSVLFHYYNCFLVRPENMPRSTHKCLIVYWRASEASETPSIATYRKKCCVYSTYVKTTMHMLTILREAEEWTRVHLREACCCS